MSDWRPGATRAVLQARAALLCRLRAFFAERQVLEVDTPLLARYSVSDPAIESLCVVARGADGHTNCGRGAQFLQTSPEFFMKRLLAAGSGDIYQLGKVFRAGESGARHNPEFTLLEWYRLGFTLDELIDEVGALVAACLGRSGWRRVSYRALFARHLAVDPHRASVEVLERVARARLDLGALALDGDAWLNLLMSHCIEPAIAADGLVFVHDYPESQAALARCTRRAGRCVAERFELYVDGVEIANGYRELLDPEELKRRAALDNEKRRRAGRAARDLDPRLLAALRSGLPDCSGVALGVDRLLLLQLGAQRLDEVMPFSAERC